MIRSFSAHLRWSNAINKCNFSTHQSAWKNYCAEIASPVRTKKSISQRKLYLLSLVEKYYNQVADLPKLQSQWFSRPIVKYQKWRAQELLNWLRTAKRILRKRVARKKILPRTQRKSRIYCTGQYDRRKFTNASKNQNPYHTFHINKRGTKKNEQFSYLYLLSYQGQSTDCRTARTDGDTDAELYRSLM